MEVVAQTSSYSKTYSSQSATNSDKGATVASSGSQGYRFSPAYTITLSPDYKEKRVSYEEVLKASGGRAEKIDPGNFKPLNPEFKKYDDELNSDFARIGYAPKGISIISYLYRTKADDAIDQGFAAMGDLNDKLVAMDSKLWKESELSANNLSKAAYSLIDSLEKSTGKYVVSQNQGIYDVKFGYAGEMCDIGINMLEFMANNRQHDDIWENVVDGKYSSLGEIDTAIRSKGDTETADKLRDETLLTVTPCDERVKDMIYRGELMEYWQNSGSIMGFAYDPRGISDEEIQAYKKSYTEEKDPYKREFTNGGYLWSAVAPRGTEKIVQQYNQYNRR